jgi:2-methylisocitrate lyase-like PEP mutase family enzyme
VSESSSAAAFAALHMAETGFIMPNAWDVGSALILADTGFAAIGTTSAGIAFSLGRQDYGVTDQRLAVSRDRMLRKARQIASEVCIPVNGDLEAGYGHAPETVAATVTAAIEAGLSGGNIEDKIPFEPRLYDETLAIERIEAAREAIAAANSSFVLTARCDAVMWSSGGLTAAIDRCNRYREAGADCLFTPGVTDIASITLLVREIDGPLNVVMGLDNAEGNAYEWLAAGVRRISLGGSIARAAYGLVRQSALELSASGSISFARAQIPQSELNALFARQHDLLARRASIL